MPTRTFSRTDAAILGMLTVEPMSGYDMKHFCDQSLAHFWHENYGNLYPRLKRLRAAGLVRGRRERRAHGPDAIVYSLTTAGRRRFREWLRQEPHPEKVRSEFLLKIFFGAQAGLERSAGWIRDYQRQQQTTKRGYADVERMLRASLRDRPEALYWLMSLRRGQLVTEARLRWCRECLALMNDMTPEATP
jgi:DNA-binding PadR family transcriptional regulator